MAVVDVSAVQETAAPTSQDQAEQTAEVVVVAVTEAVEEGEISLEEIADIPVDELVEAVTVELVELEIITEEQADQIITEVQADQIEDETIEVVDFERSYSARINSPLKIDRDTIPVTLENEIVKVDLSKLGRENLEIPIQDLDESRKITIDDQELTFQMGENYAIVEDQIGSDLFVGVAGNTVDPSSISSGQKILFTPKESFIGSLASGESIGLANQPEVFAIYDSKKGKMFLSVSTPGTDETQVFAIIDPEGQGNDVLYDISGSKKLPSILTQNDNINENLTFFGGDEPEAALVFPEAALVFVDAEESTKEIDFFSVLIPQGEIDTSALQSTSDKYNVVSNSPAYRLYSDETVQDIELDETSGMITLDFNGESSSADSDLSIDFDSSLLIDKDSFLLSLKESNAFVGLVSSKERPTISGKSKEELDMVWGYYLSREIDENTTLVHPFASSTFIGYTPKQEPQTESPFATRTVFNSEFIGAITDENTIYPQTGTGGYVVTEAQLQGITEAQLQGISFLKDQMTQQYTHFVLSKGTGKPGDSDDTNYSFNTDLKVIPLNSTQSSFTGEGGIAVVGDNNDQLAILQFVDNEDPVLSSPLMSNVGMGVQKTSWEETIQTSWEETIQSQVVLPVSFSTEIPQEPYTIFKEENSPIFKDENSLGTTIPWQLTTPYVREAIEGENTYSIRSDNFGSLADISEFTVEYTVETKDQAIVNPLGNNNSFTPFYQVSSDDGRLTLLEGSFLEAYYESLTPEYSILKYNEGKIPKILTAPSASIDSPASWEWVSLATFLKDEALGAERLQAVVATEEELNSQYGTSDEFTGNKPEEFEVSFSYTVDTGEDAYQILATPNYAPSSSLLDSSDTFVIYEDTNGVQQILVQNQSTLKIDAIPLDDHLIDTTLGERVIYEPLSADFSELISLAETDLLENISPLLSTGVEVVRPFKDSAKLLTLISVRAERAERAEDNPVLTLVSGGLSIDFMGQVEGPLATDSKYFITEAGQDGQLNVIVRNELTNQIESVSIANYLLSQLSTEVNYTLIQGTLEEFSNIDLETDESDTGKRIVSTISNGQVVELKVQDTFFGVEALKKDPLRVSFTIRGEEFVEEFTSEGLENLVSDDDLIFIDPKMWAVTGELAGAYTPFEARLNVPGGESLLFTLPTENKYDFGNILYFQIEGLDGSIQSGLAASIHENQIPTISEIRNQMGGVGAIGYDAFAYSQLNGGDLQSSFSDKFVIDFTKGEFGGSFKFTDHSVSLQHNLWLNSPNDESLAIFNGGATITIGDKVIEGGTTNFAIIEYGQGFGGTFGAADTEDRVQGAFLGIQKSN